MKRHLFTKTYLSFSKIRGQEKERIVAYISYYCKPTT